MIKALNSNDPLFGYNNTEGGETRKSLSKESRLKVSTKNKGKKRSADTRRKIAESKKNKKGNPCSQSRKLALSILMKGNTYAKNLQINKIPIIQLDLNNNVICVWESATDAGKALNIDNSGISRVCREGESGKYKGKYKNFIWKYF